MGLTGHLVAEIGDKEIFMASDHAAYMSKGEKEVIKRNAVWLEEALDETLAGCPVQVACRLQRATKTRAWLTVQPSAVNTAELDVQEW